MFKECSNGLDVHTVRAVRADLIDTGLVNKRTELRRFYHHQSNALWGMASRGLRRAAE